MAKSKTVTIKMTRQEALEMGLLVCECGWPENNHWEGHHGGHNNRTCPHNPLCTGFKERARRGKLITRGG